MLDIAAENQPVISKVRQFFEAGEVLSIAHVQVADGVKLHEP